MVKMLDKPVMRQVRQRMVRSGLVGTVGLTAGLVVWVDSAICLAQPSVQPDVLTLPSSEPPTVSADAFSSSYTLGAGDRIRVDVFRIPQYGGEMTVLANGSLNLPVVGSISLQGLTLQQAGQAIATQYRRILRNPIVTVSLITPRPVNVSVTGEVSRPGSYQLNESTSAPPTLTELLKVAGGVRQSADLRQVQIRRPQLNGTEEVVSVNLWEFLQVGGAGRNLTLRDGDTVFVPTAATVSLTESPQVAAASFAAAAQSSINIAVVGEVFRPGSYVANAGEGVPSITRAIEIAGGITPTADIRNVEVRRLTRAGEEQTFKIDLWQLLSGDLSQDAILQDRDTVIIPEAASISDTEAAQVAVASFSPDSIQINVVGEVVRPGALQVAPNLPLNQALLTAGGFNNRANRRSVELIRLNPNGTVSRRAIEIDLAQSINEDSNPALRHNDVIMVKPSGIASISDTLSTATSPLNGLLNLLTFPFSFLRLF